SSTGTTLNSLALTPYLVTLSPEEAESQLQQAVQNVFINKACRILNKMQSQDEEHSVLTHNPTPVSVGELIRQLFDNTQVLESNTVLVDLITALVPYDEGADSDSESSLDQDSSSGSDFSEIAPPTPTEPVSVNSTRINFGSTTIEQPNPYRWIEMPSKPLIFPPVPSSTMEITKGPVIHPLLARNKNIVNWDKGHPITAGKAYICGSYRDFVISYRKDKWAHIMQIGIAKKHLVQFLKDQRYFEKECTASLVDESNNTCRLTKKGRGIYDIQYSQLHWIGLNLAHICHLIDLHQEVINRHDEAEKLDRKGHLSAINLEAAVTRRLGWKDNQLPLTQGMSNVAGFKFPTPAEFDGKSDESTGVSKAREFLVKVEIYVGVYSANFPSPVDKSRLILFLCKDAAFSWASLYMPAINNTNHKKQKFLEDWDGFKAAFLAQFSSVDQEATATRELVNIRHTGKVSEFAVRFRELAAQTKWNDESKIVVYLTKLKESIRGIILTTISALTQYEEFVNWTIKIGDQVETFNSERN
ncbi:hypothetical protein FRB96_007733, partial [Tulasnella sp. 330]